MLNIYNKIEYKRINAIFGGWARVNALPYSCFTENPQPFILFLLLLLI